MPLIKARYKFGQKILQGGELNLPTEDGELVAYPDSRIPKKIWNMLDYRITMAAGVVLNKAAELYFNLGEHIIPWRIMNPGRIFGLWNLLQAPNSSSHGGIVFDISAGAHSIIMAPKNF